MPLLAADLQAEGPLMRLTPGGKHKLGAMTVALMGELVNVRAWRSDNFMCLRAPAPDIAGRLLDGDEFLLTPLYYCLALGVPEPIRAPRASAPALR